MQFIGTHKGVLMEFSTKSRKGEGVDVSTAKVEIRMTKKELVKAMSERVAEAVFAGFVTDPQLGEIWTGRFTPGGKKVVFLEHTMKLTTGLGDGSTVKKTARKTTKKKGAKSLAVQPKISAVKTVDGEEKVDVLLMLPFPCKDEAFAGRLHMATGNQVTLSMVVREPELDLPDAQGTVVTSGRFGNAKHVPA